MTLSRNHANNFVYSNMMTIYSERIESGRIFSEVGVVLQLDIYHSLPNNCILIL